MAVGPLCTIHKALSMVSGRLPCELQICSASILYQAFPSAALVRLHPWHLPWMQGSMEAAFLSEVAHLPRVDLSMIAFFIRIHALLVGCVPTINPPSWLTAMLFATTRSFVVQGVLRLSVKVAGHANLGPPAPTFAAMLSLLLSIVAHILMTVGGATSARGDNRLPRKPEQEPGR